MSYANANDNVIPFPKVRDVQIQWFPRGKLVPNWGMIFGIGFCAGFVWLFARMILWLIGGGL